ncbi:MEMAR_RS02690 family S-layer glycoprotein [Methanolacinia petrolearia]|uniref:MEMAR_RS02690 family S-layer glycoprotein n=1 Tax=Methanolacinia petrolearia TaxID=54120 RepID=UPI003BAD8F98
MTKKFALALATLMVLAFIAVGSASAAPSYGKNVTVGDAIFIGESGLCISQAVGGNTKLAWFAPSANITTDQPAIVYSIGDNQSFYVQDAMFGAYEGAWYKYTGSQPGGARLAFYVYKPSLSVSIWDIGTTGSATDVTGKKVTTGDNVTFRIDSNLFSLFKRKMTSGENLSGIDVNVVTPSGATLIKLTNSTQGTSGITNITGIQPTSQQYYTLKGANTPTSGTETVWQLNISQYSAGTYEVTAKCNVNGMTDNLGSITGVTVSETATLELDKDTVSITADKETVVRNNDFSVTIDGKPSTYYYVWMSGTNSYNYGNGSGDSDTSDIPPQFQPNQGDVSFLANNLSYGTGAGNATGLNYTYKTGTRVYQDVANNMTGLGAGAYPNPYAVEIKTGKDGLITVGITTAPNTKAATYTVRVESESDTQLYDTVKVTVEKGSVTITASGDGSYYLGEQITFSGTDTDSDYVYLFITGPNLAENGANLATPSVALKNGNASTFVTKAVNVDNTWEYKLETSTIGLDAGTYTVYAVNEPADKAHLSGTKYDTVSIVVKKPFVTATVSASTVAKGDKLHIRGTAEGNPAQGVAIWIFGKNYWNGEATNSDSMVTETVNDDGSFEYEFGSGDTKNLASGQYFVVVQHPMYNDEFNVFTSGTKPTYVVEEPVVSAYSASSNSGYNSRFVIWGGDNKLQGSDAAEALIEMIDSADIDDTYTKLTFLVEEPWIRINTVGDHYVGDQFTISGTTNLAVDDDLIVEVTSSSFTATQKSQSGEFSGQSETVKVVAGTTYNEWSMDVDASTFKADEYIVNVESIETSATATTTFNILTPGPSTATPTTTATSGPVTTTPTTTQATPTETAAPGFGALVALIGLGAVAALVLRKE